MRTHDPFLRYIANALDRVAVWCVLAIVLTGLAWAAALERGLGVRALDAVSTAMALLSRRPVDRTAATLLGMSFVIGILAATLISNLLFRRWKRLASPAAPLRGTRWENEE